jgi:hypothetical protein
MKFLLPSKIILLAVRADLTRRLSNEFQILWFLDLVRFSRKNLHFCLLDKEFPFKEVLLIHCQSR